MCLEIPAFEIVSCPPFDCAYLLAEEEVRCDDTENEGDGGDDEVGGGHSDKGLVVGEIKVRSGGENKKGEKSSQD